MYISLKIDKQVLFNACYFLIYFILLLFVNNNYAHELYSYMGAAVKELDAELFIYLLILAFASALLCGAKIRQPGDVIVVLLFLVVVPHALILNGANLFTPQASPFRGIGLAIMGGVLLIALVNKVKFVGGASERGDGEGYLFAVSFINALVLIFIIMKSASYFSFDFGEQYLRRSIAREVFSAGSFSGYIASIGTQAIFPVLFAWGVYKKNKFFVGLGILNVLVLWGAFGQKYPFLVLILVYLMMAYLRRYGRVNVSWLVLMPIAVLSLGALEYEALGYSYINDYLIRRAFTVPATLLGGAEAYVQEMGVNNYSDTLVGVLLGAPKTPPVTFEIGGWLYNSPDNNANVNFLAVAYLRLGFVAALAEALVVAVIVTLLNYLFWRRSVFLAMPIALLFASKILEQSLPTVLLGSGIFVMILLVVLMALSKRRKNESGGGYE